MYIKMTVWYNLFLLFWPSHLEQSSVWFTRYHRQ